MTTKLRLIERAIVADETARWRTAHDNDELRMANAHLRREIGGLLSENERLKAELAACRAERRNGDTRPLFLTDAPSPAEMYEAAP